MSVVSTGGPVSSRVFTVRMMESALMGLPSSERRKVRGLARGLHARTNIGYYAALDVIAVIGLKIVPNST